VPCGTMGQGNARHGTRGPSVRFQRPTSCAGAASKPGSSSKHARSTLHSRSFTPVSRVLDRLQRFLDHAGAGVSRRNLEALHY